MGGSGNDIIYAGDAGKDVIDGGSGHDILSFAQAAQRVTVNSNDADTLNHIEMVIGSDFDDNIAGIGNIRHIDGRAGDDTIYGQDGKYSGGAGDDFVTGVSSTLLGRDGDDRLQSYSGDSTLDGGAGADTLTGGTGKDSFRFSSLDGTDLVRDMKGDDTIDLSRIDADATTAGDQAFHLSAALDGHAGELVAAYDDGAKLTTLSGDVDGDGVADLVIQLSGDQTGFANYVL